MFVFGVFLVRIFPHSDWMWRDKKYLSVFSRNAGKNGTEKLRIWILFTQCYSKYYLGYLFVCTDTNLKQEAKTDRKNQEVIFKKLLVHENLWSSGSWNYLTFFEAPSPLPPWSPFYVFNDRSLIHKSINFISVKSTLQILFIKCWS